MNSQSVAGILGAIVASIVLVAAVVYGPMGQSGKPARPASVQPAAVQPVPAAPVPRGPVIREVPNNQ
jgi:energy-converting hydrogenase Eha subunit A